MKKNLLKLVLSTLALMPMGAWAADKTNVSGFEMWTFDQYHPGQVVSAVTNYGQLYLRGNSSNGHGITMTASAVNVTFTYNNFAFKVGNFASIPANSYASSITSQIKDNFVARNAIGNASDRSFAMDFTVAGKVYMWVRATNVNDAGTNSKKIYAAVSNGPSGSSSNYATSSEVHTFTTEETNPFEIQFDVEAGKSYMFISEASFRLYAVAFVPTGFDTSDARRRVSFADSDYVTFMTDYPCILDNNRFKAYYASASDGSTVTLSEYSGSVLAANVPVVLKYLNYDENKDISLKLAAKNGTLVAPADNLLKPVYSDTYALGATNTNGTTTYTNYILAKSGDDYVFAPSTGEGSIQNWFAAKGSNYLNVGKAYLFVESSEPTAPQLSIVFNDNETTGISEKVIVKSENLATAPAYNLAGQRVAQPKKGLYIVNGKKVMFK